MKNLVGMMVVVLLATSISVSAQDLSRGRNELALGGVVRLDEPDPIDYQIFVDLKYGRFIREGFQLGVNATVYAHAQSWTVSLGPLAEYNFILGNRWPRLARWVPFVGASVALATAEIDQDWGFDVERDRGLTKSESSRGVVVTGESGLKYFLSDSVALATSFNFSWSSDDVFSGENDVKNLLLGIRAYF